jgi:hypothetical protein
METVISGRTFKYYEDLWMCYPEHETSELTFEIYNESIDSDLVAKIFSMLDDKSIQLLYTEAISWLMNLSLSFWKRDMQPAFTLSGITIGLNGGNKQSDFSLCYHMSSKIDTFSDYANWLVDIRDFKIVACSREQV